MKNLALFLFALIGLSLASGCVHRIPDATPADIPRLEQALVQSPGNPDLLTQLGMAQFKARRYEAAEGSLAMAIESGEATGAAYLYLGLARESQEKWGGARESYSSYLEAGRFGPLKEEIERRLYLIVRQELRAQAQDALARESELSTATPAPGTVAVFPFQVVTEDEDLLPLQVALADMMTTDLELSGGLRVLERTQIQTLLTEMALTEAGFTDPETGARAGRLLRAEHIVQGALLTLPNQNLQFATDVLNTARSESRGEATAENALEHLFDLEKESVFQILGILGVELTPSEREAITNNRAANLFAFLAFGQGLQALDRGDFAQAGDFFNRAVELDPGFTAALKGQAEAAALQEATGTGPDDVGGRSTGELSPPTLSGTDPGLSMAGSASSTSSILNATANEVVPTPVVSIVGLGSVSTGTTEQGQTRDPAQESKGQEGVTTPTTASILITIRRPGGGN